jgi:hypothetical protein
MEGVQQKGVELRDTKDAPNLELLKQTFGVTEDEVIIAYGNAIYAPNKTLSRDLLVHELVHCKRQGFNERSAERWWEKYMSDPQFRFMEECFAYHEQYEYIKKVYKDKNRQAKILHALAVDLSGERYGKIVSYHDAIAGITNPLVRSLIS